MRAPPPLESELHVVRRRAAGSLSDTLVAEGRPAELLLEVPDPIAYDEVAAAVEAGREHWSAHHPFPAASSAVSTVSR